MNYFQIFIIKLLPIIKIMIFSVLLFLVHIVIMFPMFATDTLTLAGLENKEDNVLRILLVGTSLVATTLSILIANRLAKSWKPSLTTLGITTLSIFKNIGIGLLVGGVLISTCFLVVVGISDGQIEFVGFSLQASLFLLLLFILISVFEELLSRGYLLPYLQKHYGTVWAIGLSSLIFTALHLANDHLSVTGLLSIFLAGVLLAQLRLVYQNLWVPIGVHFIWNYLQGAVYGFSVSGHHTESIFVPNFEAPSLINGGMFGIEGSVVTVVILLIAIIAFRRSFTKEIVLPVNHPEEGTEAHTNTMTHVVVNH